MVDHDRSASSIDQLESNSLYAENQVILSLDDDIEASSFDWEDGQ